MAFDGALASPRSGDAGSGSSGGGRIALLLPSLGGGGAEASMLRTAAALLERGHEVDLVVCRKSGPLVDQVALGVRVVELQPGFGISGRLHALAADPGGVAVLARPVLLARKAPHRLPFLPDLVRYLRERRPEALLAALPTPNLMAVWARRLARVGTRIVVSERSTLSATIDGVGKWRKRYLPPLLRRTYLMADGIIAVSNGVAADLASVTGIPPARITTVYNPVVTPELHAKARQPLDHPWFQPGAPPVVLGVGSLTPQKDFPTLIRAFARVRAHSRGRLVILGQAASPRKTEEQRAELMALAASLGITDEIDLPGFVSNPFAYMARAAAFVLSSRREGLPGVLIQALACGCPVVSTDCPHGPMEILDGGRYGELVPIADVDAMARAIHATLESTPDRALLRRRAATFSVDAAIDRYIELLLGASVAENRRADPAKPVQHSAPSSAEPTLSR